MASDTPDNEKKPSAAGLRRGSAAAHTQQQKKCIAIAGGCLAIVIMAASFIVPKLLGSGASWGQSVARPYASDGASNTATTRTHMTALQQQIARKLVLPIADADACSRDPNVEQWGAADFAAAVETHRLFRTRRGERLGHAGDKSSSAGWLNLSPDLSPCAALRRVGPEGKGGAYICHTRHLGYRGCAVASYTTQKELASSHAFELAALGQTPCDVFRYSCPLSPNSNKLVRPGSSCAIDDTAAQAISSGRSRARAELASILRSGAGGPLALFKVFGGRSALNILGELSGVAAADWNASFALLPRQIALTWDALLDPPPDGLETYELVDEAFAQLLEMGYVAVSLQSDSTCASCLESTWIRVPQACWSRPPKTTLG